MTRTATLRNNHELKGTAIGKLTEPVHHIIDMNYDEDRGRIRTGHGPENITRLRRFAVGVLKSFQKRTQSIAQMMRKLSFRPRLVFDYLRITANSATGARVP